MKKNKMMRLASTLLVLCLMSTCVISGTFAKYVSEASGSDSARVAKWSFKVGDKDIAAESGDITFELFKTIVDTVDSKTDANVSYAEQIIAPGTQGEFAIVLTNLSEVDAKYAIDYTCSETVAIPIKFSVDGATWTDELADVAASDADFLVKNGGTKTIKVQWKWDYEVNDVQDEADTKLGVDAYAGTESKITVTAKITATQVD